MIWTLRKTLENPDMNNDKIVSMGIVITKLKFRYSEKTKKFQKNLPILATLLSNVKQIGRFLQNFVAFSEHLNFKNLKNRVWMCLNVFFFYFEKVIQKTWFHIFSGFSKFFFHSSKLGLVQFSCMLHIYVHNVNKSKMNTD